MSEALPKNKDGDEHVIWGYVVSVRDVDNHLDEISCIPWFNDDMTPIKITMPAGMFQLRDKLEISFSPVRTE